MAEPIHELISRKLMFAPVGMNFPAAIETKIGEAMLLLDLLFNGEMPAEDAHKIARQRADLPGLFKSAGQPTVADFAEQVLENLRARQDEEEVGQPAT